MQTAVEWLVGYITSDGHFDMQKVIEQAKAMEKEQIIDAHKSGQSLICKQAADLFEHGIQMDDSEGVEQRDAEQYYNETFKTDKG